MPFANFRRQPVPQQFEQALKSITFPAPTRGIVLSENEAYMQPGGANVQVNWLPTMRGVKLRGGYIRHCVLPQTTPVISAFEYVSAERQLMFAANATALYNVTSAFAADAPAWQNSAFYNIGAMAKDTADNTIWQAVTAHLTGATGTFAAFRAAIPGVWTAVAVAPSAIRTGHASGNYVSAQMSNAANDWIVVVNDAGDFVMRSKDGIAWLTLDGNPAGTPTDGASNITYDPTKITAGMAQGKGLVYVWKYRNRLFFIEASSMNAWYLPIDAIGGVLLPIPLGGSATKGGYLLFGAVWSLDTGDGADDKCVFYTSEGEALIFSGTDPSDANNWRQEGRYAVGKALGMNAHLNIGGDLLVLTIEGIIPLSVALTKEAGQLELSMITRTIKPLWRDTALVRNTMPWTAKRWDELGGFFIAAPGGSPGDRFAFAANNTTGAWCQVTYDATCFIRMRGDMFFGTQRGIIMQAERSGYDDGAVYTATLVGGWEMFGAQANTVVWHQARASFRSGSGEPFQPQLSATVDYIIVIPPPPPVGPDPGGLDVWDQGHWGPDMGGPPPPVPTAPQRAQYTQWDQPAPAVAPRNTMWISIGMTGFAHAPIVQVAIGQQAKPDVELIAISATFEAAGVNV